MALKGKSIEEKKQWHPSGIDCRPPHEVLVLLIECYSCYGAVAVMGLSCPEFYRQKREVGAHPGRRYPYYRHRG